MNREDVRKLLGGYATGTLSAAEREALFAAALDDQELFDALMKEEALREVMEEPATKAQLLAALEKPAGPPAWWSWRPLIGAVAMAGLALAAVAVWRGTRGQPTYSTVAEVAKQNSAPAVPPTEHPAAVVKSEAKAARKPMLRDARRTLQERDSRAVRQPEPSAKAKAEAMASATAVATAPPPSSPPEKQQPAGQPADTSSTAQQQAAQAPLPAQAAPTAQSIAVEAAPVLNRAVGASGFRTGAPVKEMSGELLVQKKVAGPLQWSILRGVRVVPPGTVLDAGETVRLRIYSFYPGTLTLTEGDKTLFSARVEPAKPFDTPPIPFTAPGLRLLRISLTTGAPQPEVVAVTLSYGQ